ncbi:MAG TPA: peptidylprolyl isomerase [Geopsychrobacteraceae bacterium]
MKRFMATTLLFLALATPAAAGERVVMETSLGTITLELFSDKAPVTVKNFLGYIDRQFYDGTVFHRVIDNFMIQGGGFDQQLQKKAVEAAIANEADNGLKNDKGTLAMARTAVVDSATSQFFINLKDNDFLNHRGKSSQGYGYTVFGRVVAGMEVVEKIGKVATVRKGMHQNLPQPPVVLKSLRRVAEQKK